MTTSELIVLSLLSGIGLAVGIAMVYLTWFGKLVLPENNRWYSGLIPCRGDERWLVRVGVVWSAISTVGLFVALRGFVVG